MRKEKRKEEKGRGKGKGKEREREKGKKKSGETQKPIDLIGDDEDLLCCLVSGVK